MLPVTTIEIQLNYFRHASQLTKYSQASRASRVKTPIYVPNTRGSSLLIFSDTPREQCVNVTPSSTQGKMLLCSWLNTSSEFYS